MRDRTSVRERTIPHCTKVVRKRGAFKRATRRDPDPSRRDVRLRTYARRNVAPVAVDEERTRLALHDLGPNDDLLDGIEPGQVIHGVEEDALHDGAQAAGARLALDGLL